MLGLDPEKSLSANGRGEDLKREAEETNEKEKRGILGILKPV